MQPNCCCLINLSAYSDHGPQHSLCLVLAASMHRRLRSSGDENVSPYVDPDQSHRGKGMASCFTSNTETEDLQRLSPHHTHERTEKDTSLLSRCRHKRARARSRRHLLRHASLQALRRLRQCCMTRHHGLPTVLRQDHTPAAQDLHSESAKTRFITTVR
jgi:hypothetical protein